MAASVAGAQQLEQADSLLSCLAQFVDNVLHNVYILYVFAVISWLNMNYTDK